MLVPHNLGQAKVGDLDFTNTAGAEARNELAFVDLVLVARLLRFRNLGGDKIDRVEKNVFGFNVT